MGIGDFMEGMAVIFAIVAGAWALVKFAARQFDQKLVERFKAQELIRQEASKTHDQRFARLEESERDFQKFKVEVHREFMRREDSVREIASIKILVENLALNVDRKLTEIWQAVRKVQ